MQYQLDRHNCSNRETKSMRQYLISRSCNYPCKFITVLIKAWHWALSWAKGTNLQTTRSTAQTHFNTGCGKLTSFFIWIYSYKKGS
jgi:hypothetical protein